MATFNLQIVTPDKLFYNEDVDMLVVRTTEGDVGILGHCRGGHQKQRRCEHQGCGFHHGIGLFDKQRSTNAVSESLEHAIRACNRETFYLAHLGRTCVTATSSNHNSPLVSCPLPLATRLRSLSV